MAGARRSLWALGALSVTGLALSGVSAVLLGSGMTRQIPVSEVADVGSPAPADAARDAEGADPARTLQKDVARLETARKKLLGRITRLRPQGIWVLIDSGANRISLMDGDKVLLNAVCSTGKGTPLEDPQTGRRWVFNTPRGEFEVRSKKIDPVWIKPDWAFIEEGEPLPKSYKERVEPDMLGDYAMDLGDGYLIHGTLYKRALGMSVTHGCVRVGDEDLARIFKTVQIGTRVYII